MFCFTHLPVTLHQLVIKATFYMYKFILSSCVFRKHIRSTYLWIVIIMHLLHIWAKISLQMQENKCKIIFDFLVPLDFRCAIDSVKFMGLQVLHLDVNYYQKLPVIWTGKRFLHKNYCLANCHFSNSGFA